MKLFRYQKINSRSFPVHDSKRVSSRTKLLWFRIFIRCISSHAYIHLIHQERIKTNSFVSVEQICGSISAIRSHTCHLSLLARAARFIISLNLPRRISDRRNEGSSSRSEFARNWQQDGAMSEIQCSPSQTSGFRDRARWLNDLVYIETLISSE